ncbi:hypothetical protein ACLB1G_27605 [Oxalobacteraceae bacterium A2-2]
MSHTLAAVFETRSDAERAKAELVSGGFAINDISLSDSTTVASSAESRTHDDDSITGSIKHFFQKLFGDEHEDRHIYAGAVSRGHVVLTVQTITEDEADRASDIIEAFSPLDIDEHETDWRSGAWTGADAMRSGVGMSQAGLGAQQSSSLQSSSSSAPLQPQGAPLQPQGDLGRSQQGLSSSDSLQRESTLGNALGVNDPLSAGQRTERSTSRVYPRSSVPPAPNEDSLAIQRGGDFNDEDDLYFRSHWDKTYSYAGGTYQEFDPAYRYGHSMAGSSAYQGRSWDDAENDLRGTWERSYPQSSWDKFKDAVREGWDRITR